MTALIFFFKNKGYYVKIYFGGDNLPTIECGVSPWSSHDCLARMLAHDSTFCCHKRKRKACQIFLKKKIDKKLQYWRTMGFNNGNVQSILNHKTDNPQIVKIFLSTILTTHNFFNVKYILMQFTGTWY